MDHAFKALAHPQRRVLLKQIAASPKNAGELAVAAGLRQPTASQHLRILRDAGFVTVEVQGNRRIYHINFERLGELRLFLESFWVGKLERLRAVAEGSEEPSEEPEEMGP